MQWWRLGGDEVWFLLILKLGTRWRWVVSVTPQPRFALGERTPSPYWIGDWVGRSGHRGQRKNQLPLPGIEPRSPGRPVRSQTLYWYKSYTFRKYVLIQRSALLPCSSVYHVSLITAIIMCTNLYDRCHGNDVKIFSPYALHDWR
jgi:hypothetical protein